LLGHIAPVAGRGGGIRHKALDRLTLRILALAIRFSGTRPAAGCLMGVFLNCAPGVFRTLEEKGQNLEQVHAQIV
jgi:hypothetical protein